MTQRSIWIYIFLQPRAEQQKKLNKTETKKPWNVFKGKSEISKLASFKAWKIDQSSLSLSSFIKESQLIAFRTTETRNEKKNGNQVDWWVLSQFLTRPGPRWVVRKSEDSEERFKLVINGSWFNVYSESWTGQHLFLIIIASSLACLLVRLFYLKYLRSLRTNSNATPFNTNKTENDDCLFNHF